MYMYISTVISTSQILRNRVKDMFAYENAVLYNLHVVFIKTAFLEMHC